MSNRRRRAPRKKGGLSELLGRARGGEGPTEFMPSARIAYRYRLRFLGWLLDGHVYLREAFAHALPKAIRRELAVNERIAEVPFALRALDLPRGARVIDVGSRWSALPLELVSLGYRVVATDIAPFPVQGAGFEYVLADMRTPPFKQDSFDGATVVSTLEHVGIGFYDERRDTEDDIVMMNAFLQIVRPGGVLALTVPFGVSGVGRVQRSYDRDRLGRIARGWILDQVHYFVRRGAAWIETTEAEASIADSAVQTEAVAMVRFLRPQP